MYAPPPEAAVVADDVELRRFATVQDPQRVRPTIGWVLSPQVIEDVTVELRRFAAGPDRSRSILHDRSQIYIPQIAEEFSEDLRHFTIAADRQFARPVIGWILPPQLAEAAAEVERQTFISSSDLSRRVLPLHSWVVGPQIIEDLTEELRRWLLPSDKQRGILTYDSRAWAPQIEAVAAEELELRPFILTADRQPRIRLPIAFVRGHAGPAGVVVMPEELQRFLLGQDRIKEPWKLSGMFPYAVVPDVVPEEAIIRFLLSGPARAPRYAEDVSWFAGSPLSEPEDLEVLRFLLSAPRSTASRFTEAVQVRHPQMPETPLLEELRRFLVGQDRQPGIEPHLWVLGPQIAESADLPEQLRKFLSGSDRQFVRQVLSSVLGIQREEDISPDLLRFLAGSDRQLHVRPVITWMLPPQIGEVVEMPIELLKFVTGAVALRRAFFNITGIWLPEDFFSAAAPPVTVRKEWRKQQSWHRHRSQ
jgi:hypothetical protein